MTSLQRDRTFRILLADDHELVRRGIRDLFSNNPRWDICGEATNGREAIEKVLEMKPDLAILDITMPELNGIEAAREISRIAPRAKIIILSMHEGLQLELAARQAGADAVIVKRSVAESLVQEVEHLLAANISDADDSIRDSINNSVELPE
jgi:DNA-binding NarL/FixJ family response regulator